jgi:hypothetical protein
MSLVIPFARNSRDKKQRLGSMIDHERNRHMRGAISSQLSLDEGYILTG